MQQVRHLEYRVADLDNAEDGVRYVASQLVPGLQDVPLERIVLKEYSGGATNRLFLAKCGHVEGLIRVYGVGTEQLIDRDTELAIMAELTGFDLSPSLFGTYTNGSVYEHLKGRSLHPDDLPLMTSRIGASLASWHSRHLQSIPFEVKLWSTMRKWLKLSLESRWQQVQPYTRQQLADEVAYLEEQLSRVESRIVFTHCDLLGGNIIFDASSPNRVRFIDMEYACYNPRGFDLGNHWCEWGGYTLPEGYSRYPSREHQQRFIRAYLKAQFVRDGNPSEDAVNALYHESNKYALASHLFWGIWAVCQADLSEIDFDFVEYARVRLNTYFNTRDRFLKASGDHEYYIFSGDELKRMRQRLRRCDDAKVQPNAEPFADEKVKKKKKKKKKGKGKQQQQQHSSKSSKKHKQKKKKKVKRKKAHGATKNHSGHKKKNINGRSKKRKPKKRKV